MEKSETNLTNDYLLKLFDLKDKVAIVTGGARGIGAAIANGLDSAGVTTFALGRSDKASEELNHSVSYQLCDITETNAFAVACQQIGEQVGKIDVLINAAGITLPSSEGLQNLDSFQKTIDVNLTGTYTCCYSVLPYMKKAGGGSIINITSIGAVLGFPNNPGYVASKGGLQMLTKALAVDLAPYQIRVNNVAPGYIHTSMTDISFSDPEKHDARLQNMLIKRWGKPEDLVGSIIYLASPAASYVTGTDLFVDGGWTTKGL